MAKQDSPLVKSVLALDTQLAELERIGAKINSTNMTADLDIDYIQKLMTRFAECGQRVSEEVANLSTHLQDARSRAEAVAQGVSGQAQLFNDRRNEQGEKLERFRILGEKVGELNASISQFKDQDRVALAATIPAIAAQLTLVIEELQDLRKSARDSRMKTLERNAESLAQSLQAVREKLRELIPLNTENSN